MNLKEVVRAGEQKIAKVMGREKLAVPPVIPGVPQAEGAERERLIVYADQLVDGEIFTHQSFADFVGTMRGLIGLARPDGYSNGFPGKGLGINVDYLKFGNNGNTWIAIEREKDGDRFDLEQRGLSLGQSEDGFSLKMAIWPSYPYDIRDIRQLFNIDKITFTADEDADLLPDNGNGKGGIFWTRAPLSESIVQNFCGKIVKQVQALPLDYTFVPGEVIDERKNQALKQSRTLKARFLNRYFKY